MSSGVETSLAVQPWGDGIGLAEMTEIADKIIVALDVATAEEALGLVKQLRPQVSRFKVGLQLYTAGGPHVVRDIAASGAKIFLDLKFHDIPNTVAGAVTSALSLGVDMLTIHLSGGEPMVRAAVQAAQEQVTILGVTVLTSQNDESLGSIGINESLSDHVRRLATMGVSCGIEGLVASPQEAAMLKRFVPAAIKIITPGIRPGGTSAGDQKRVATPRAAIEAGADYLVIGRPITAAPDPVAAMQSIMKELAPS
jgi:orotidine-5'-phosphate decarboxylase